MPDQNQRPEEETLEAPEQLVEALGQLHKERIFVPPAVDQMVLRVAAEHLQRLERPHARWKPWLSWAAMAACLALTVWLAERFSSSVRARPFAREDVNLDGRVDVLDAFALARRIDAGGTLDRRWDVNADGRVDRADVNAIAARAVSLPQAGPEPKRNADARPYRADSITIGSPAKTLGDWQRSCGSQTRAPLVAGPRRWKVSQSRTLAVSVEIVAGDDDFRSAAVRAVSVYRGFGVSEWSAAFTPLPLGTPCVALRIFQSAGKGS